jgi:hypothetical protein
VLALQHGDSLGSMIGLEPLEDGAPRLLRLDREAVQKQIVELIGGDRR